MFIAFPKMSNNFFLSVSVEYLHALLCLLMGPDSSTWQKLVRLKSVKLFLFELEFRSPGKLVFPRKHERLARNKILIKREPASSTLEDYQ